MGLAVSLARAASRMVILGAFATLPRLFVEVETHGLERDPRQPYTYYALLHKRDIDPVLLTPPLLFHCGWRAVVSDVHFAMRSDGFAPGFLARIVARPAWAAWLLRPLSVGPALRLLGAHPLTDYALRPAEARIWDALRAEGDGMVKDNMAGDVLAAPFLESLAAATGSDLDDLGHAPSSSLLRWRYFGAMQRYVGPDLLTGIARRRADRRAVAEAKAQLDTLARWLQGGGSLLGSPEGRLSPDGAISPISAGLHRLLRAAPAQTRIIPLALVYDFMTTGRLRLCIDLATSIKDAPTLPAPLLDHTLMTAWRRAARFTWSQLGAAFLVRQGERAPSAFTFDELVAAVMEEAATLANAGRHVDTALLSAASARAGARCFLRYATRQGLVQPSGRTRWQPTIGDLSIPANLTTPGYDRWPLAYAWNEYRDMTGVEDSLQVRR